MHLRPVSRGCRTLCCLAFMWSGFLVTPATATESRRTLLVNAIQRVAPSVVNIHTEKTARDQSHSYGQVTARKVNGMGSGIIIDERGYIVTNQHVVQDTDSLRVTLSNHATYRAELISFDPKHDLAIIKINSPSPLPVAPIGTSTDMMLGETVVAIGNAFGYENTVTEGIVSAMGRDVEVNDKQGYKNLIQTDASINPGNSGGPLVNLDGEVVGINVAIRANAQRIGFAIPIDDARIRMAKLLDIQKLSYTWHGLVGRDVKTTSDKMQLLVQSLKPESPALLAGLMNGDIVTQVGTQEVHDQADWERALLGFNSGEKIDVKVVRNGAETPLIISLAAVPNAPPVAQRPKVVARTQTVARANNPEAVLPPMTPDEEKVWTLLGVRLEVAPEGKVKGVNSRFNGGMTVVEVRPDSPAAKKQIYKGDILCGLHIWQTENLDNVLFVTNHDELPTFGPLKFFVLRDTQLLYGFLTLPTTVASAPTIEPQVK